MPQKSHKFSPRPGEIVKVKHVQGGYPLPDGLEPGDEVYAQRI